MKIHAPAASRTGHRHHRRLERHRPRHRDRRRERGARVVLAARNGDDLERAVEEIQRRRRPRHLVVADVADPAQVERIADATVASSARIDTWVNNAAVSMYGRIMDVPHRGHAAADGRELLGPGVRLARRGAAPARSRAARSSTSPARWPTAPSRCRATTARRSTRSKAFTDALRMELEEEGVPISVTLVKPASIDTPFFEKAKTYLGVEPQPVPPVYAPEVVSEVILRAAQHPLRELIAGGSGAKLSAARFVPRLADLYMERWTFDSQRTDAPTNGRADNLYTPVAEDGGERGRNWTGHAGGAACTRRPRCIPR